MEIPPAPPLPPPLTTTDKLMKGTLSGEDYRTMLLLSIDKINDTFELAPGNTVNIKITVECCSTLEFKR